MYSFEVKFDKTYQKILTEITNLNNMFQSASFKEFIKDKALDELNKIIQQRVNNFGDGEEHPIFIQKVEEYKKNNKTEIGSDYILIFNDTMLTYDEMTWVSEKTKINYLDGLSISYLIEYGSGLKGTSQSDWETNVNNHKGTWSYIGSDDKIYHTDGIEGRFIYDTLLQSVKNKFEEWTLEFLDERSELYAK